MAMSKTPNAALERVRSQYGMKWSPFSPINLAFLLIIATLSFGSFYRIAHYLLMTSIVLITSFIPSVAFYPDILTEGGLIATLPICLFLGFCFVVHWIQNKLIQGRYKKFQQDKSLCSI